MISLQFIFGFAEEYSASVSLRKEFHWQIAVRSWRLKAAHACRTLNARSSSILTNATILGNATIHATCL